MLHRPTQPYLFRHYSSGNSSLGHQCAIVDGSRWGRHTKNIAVLSVLRGRVLRRAA